MERVYSAVFPAEELPSAPASGEDATTRVLGLTADALEQHDLKTRESFAVTEDGLGESDDDRTTQQRALSDLIDDVGDDVISSDGFHSVSDDTEEPEITAKPVVYTPPTPAELKKDLKAALRATIRAFVLAYGAKAFTALLLALRKWSNFKSGSKSALLQLVDPDTVRFGAFMGSLVGVFRFGEIAARLVRGKKDETNLAIAGGLSGLTLLVDAESRRTTISLYIFVRMLDVVSRNLTASGVIPAFKYSTELLFALSNSAILYAYYINPSALTKGYYKWIESVGGLKDAGLEHTIRERLLKGVDVDGVPIPFRECQSHYHSYVCFACVVANCTGRDQHDLNSLCIVSCDNESTGIRAWGTARSSGCAAWAAWRPCTCPCTSSRRCSSSSSRSRRHRPRCSPPSRSPHCAPARS